jgi:hypothetical protein
MPKKSKVKTDFAKDDESKFSVSAGKVVTSITTNATDFTFLIDPITVLGAEMVIYDRILRTPDYPSKAGELKASRNNAQKYLTKTGNLINTTADGFEVLLKKSGFPMAKEDEAQGVLPPTELTIGPNNIVGELDYSISLIDESNIRYAMMMTLASNPETNPDNWKFYYCAQRNGTIEDLESNVDYKFVSFAMGTEKKIVYSEVVIARAK